MVNTWLESIEAWLSSHQLLSFSIITPVVSFLIAYFTARQAFFAQISENTKGRTFQSTTQLAEFRQEWIDALRDDMAEFAALSSMSFKGDAPIEIVSRFVHLGMRIRLRMNRDDADYDELTQVLQMAEADMMGQLHESRAHRPIILICQSILKREWERLKSDLVAVNKA